MSDYEDSLTIYLRGLKILRDQKSVINVKSDTSYPRELKINVRGDNTIVIGKPTLDRDSSFKIQIAAIPEEGRAVSVEDVVGIPEINKYLDPGEVKAKTINWEALIIIVIIVLALGIFVFKMYDLQTDESFRYPTGRSSN